MRPMTSGCQALTHADLYLDCKNLLTIAIARPKLLTPTPRYVMVLLL
jgi:hypothetical protein